MDGLGKPTMQLPAWAVRETKTPEPHRAYLEGHGFRSAGVIKGERDEVWTKAGPIPDWAGEYDDLGTPIQPEPSYWMDISYRLDDQKFYLGADTDWFRGPGYDDPHTARIAGELCNWGEL